MTFAQRRNRLTTHFSERIPVVKRRMAVFSNSCLRIRLHAGGVEWSLLLGRNGASDDKDQQELGSTKQVTKSDGLI